MDGRGVGDQRDQGVDLGGRALPGEHELTGDLLEVVQLLQRPHVAVGAEDQGEVTVRELARDGREEVDRLGDRAGVVVDDRGHGHPAPVDALPDGREAFPLVHHTGDQTGDAGVLDAGQVHPLDGATVAFHRLVRDPPDILHLLLGRVDGGVGHLRGDLALGLQGRGHVARLLQHHEQVRDGVRDLDVAQRLPRQGAGEREQHDHRHGQGREDLSSNAESTKHGISSVARRCGPSSLTAVASRSGPGVNRTVATRVGYARNDRPHLFGALSARH